MNQYPPEEDLFDESFRARLHDLFVWRRDVRRFRTDPLPAGMLERLIEEACLAPSVGLSQPWRFVLVDDQTRRQAIIENFAACNLDAGRCYDGERAQLYARLKLEGLRNAPGHLAVFCDRSTDIGHGLGRRTMPEMIDYSVVSAIGNLWLAARANGIGLGWISILDQAGVAESLNVPADWHFIGYLCVGYPEAAASQPELEKAGWETRQPAASFIFRR